MNNLPTSAFPYETTPKKNNKTIIMIISFIIVTILLILLLNIKIYKIHGTSMNPTLVEGDIVVCFRTNSIQRGDLVAFNIDDNFVIKRVIALPNETIEILEDGQVKINDTTIQENYVKSLSIGEPDISFPYEVGPNSYFVLGDNREDSLDSRHKPIGTLTKEDIICKVKLVI